ncbi:MAG: epoxyqueuosine reductase [Candidatus Freyarchaeota archaeon]|nr:hypothetical protein [Candidatus Freyrarchaeum guaymaensis]
MLPSKIIRFTNSFVNSYPSIRHTVTTWRSPLIGFASASDPLFERLPYVVKGHLHPSDLIDDAETVIAFFIPFTYKTVYSNVNGRYASKLWAIAYVETNKLLTDLAAGIVDLLRSEGFRAEAPPPTHVFNEETLTSNWSHKHVAYIAGLGTFGVHHMIITEKGCCGRLTSIVTNAKIKPTPRPENEFCLHKSGVKCLKCVEKCIFKALTENKLNKHKCYKVCLENAKHYEELGVADVCGKCVAATPCSLENPVKNRNKPFPRKRVSIKS